jgi:tetratricopeptide (TPR) repeat protein
MWNVDTAKRSFALARDFYDKKEYDSAIEHYIIACKDYTFSIVYYHLGLCLMDAGDYENAKKAFEKSLNLYVDRYTYDLFTLDANDIPRETYFAYYNIACIESLQNNVEVSYDYLSKAVFYGYSYTDHLKNDPDLKNVLSYDNGVYLKAIEERIANIQFNDEKAFEYNLIDDGKAVMITRYRGTRTDVHIPLLIRNLFVTAIAEQAFFRRGLTTVIIGSAVTSIGKSAFAYNQITDIIIPPRVKTIGYDSFANNLLERVTIPAGLKCISSGAFKSNQLKHAVIPHGVLQAQHYAFMDNQIENLYLPRTLDWIDEWAFKNNPIVSVTLGSSVDFLPFYGEQLDHDFLLLYYKKESQAGTYVYEKGKWKLKYRNTAVFDNRANYNNQPAFDEDTGLLYIGDASGKRGYAADNGEFWCIENEDYVEISSFRPSPVDRTFEYFEIPEFINKKPVKIIGESAFSDVKMKGVILPAHVEVIKESAFHGCNIENIIFNDVLKEIGVNAFVNCRIADLVIPDSVTEISPYAFWASNIDNVIIGKGINKINAGVFSGAHVKTVTLPPKLEAIEENAFWYCQIKEIVIPDSVRKIGQDALSDNPFSQITIGADVAFSLSENYKDFNSFIDFYHKNNRRAGKYVRNYNDNDYEYYWEYEE